MGKIKQDLSEPTFTPLQKFIFDEFSKNLKLTKQFYFTGGTALSAFYLHHRESEDLDFFSDTEFTNEEVEKFIEKVAKSKRFEIRFTPRERTMIFELVKAGKVQIKVDFAYYPYTRIKRGIKVNTVNIDSKQDIATNKLHTITSRTEVKDFVDLYFLLKEFTFWDLFYGVKEKFKIELDLFWLGADFLKVESFKYLPKMLKPLKLEDLQNFFRERAKKIGLRIVEK